MTAASAFLRLTRTRCAAIADKLVTLENDPRLPADARRVIGEAVRAIEGAGE